VSVWSAPERQSAAVVRLANRPVAHTTGAVLSAACGVIGLVAPIEWGGRVALLVAFGGMGALVGWLARKRYTTLEISDRIRWTRPGLVLDLDRSVARRVAIRRSRWLLSDPTDYLLEVEVEGRPAKLLFAEHWVWGGPALSRARRVAESLGLELHDDRAELLRRWWWSPLHRLAYAGHEWAAMALVAIALVGLAWLVA